MGKELYRYPFRKRFFEPFRERRRHERRKKWTWTVIALGALALAELVVRTHGDSIRIVLVVCVLMAFWSPAMVLASRMDLDEAIPRWLPRTRAWISPEQRKRGLSVGDHHAVPTIAAKS